MRRFDIGGAFNYDVRIIFFGRNWLMDFDVKGTVLITCSPGLVERLAAEVEALGFEVAGSHKAGVETRASLCACERLNLNLRTAFGVLFLLGQFDCGDPDELYMKVYAIEWEDIVSSGEYVSVVSRVDTPTIKNSMFASARVKDAVVDRIADKTGSRPDSGASRENAVIQVYWKKERCWVYLNTSGRKLADRGYRKMPYKAPMQETLAAGVVLETGYDGNGAFVSPMCGSGTLAIEAALIALGKAPGLLRSNYGFMHVKGFDNKEWQDLRRETLKKAKKALAAPIIATDIEEEAIKAARQNAKTAGVEHLMEFDVCDFAETKIPGGGGVVILNPEYGKRMGEVRQLEQVYKRIGDFFKRRCAGYRGYIFTGNMELAKKVGLRTSRRVQFFNGEIECRLLQYELYEGARRNVD